MFSNTPATVKLVSSDGRAVLVPLAIARMSATIRALLDDLPNRAKDDHIPLPNVNGEILERVFDWCKQHQDDPESEEEEDDLYQKITIPQWDQNFLNNMGQELLFELILAANNLDIKKLLDITCQTVANMMKGKTPEEIRETFNIKNDFTPAEEEQIRRENELCHEQ